MKFWMLVCEAMADEPLEDLGGRTPLEAAKTPFMDGLAKKGRVGSALFTPHTLLPTSDVACFSILGFDPEKAYTGIAPLEALSMGIPQNDHEVAFRCDLVTVLDEQIMDMSAGRISALESKLLVQELNKKLSSGKVKIYPGEGYKNILIINDPVVANELDTLECTPPQNIIGQKFVKHLPKGKAAGILTDLMDASKAILENHEINRVRIDLGENPANMIWPWGQGTRPKVPDFEQRYGRGGSVVSESDFVHGIAKALGLRITDNFDSAAREGDFTFVFNSARIEGHGVGNLKSKIKWIEDFDARVVGAAVKAAQNEDACRICVTTDYAASLQKKSAYCGPVPFLICGQGIDAEEAGPFNEKICSQSKWKIDPGYGLMEVFLKS